MAKWFPTGKIHAKLHNDFFLVSVLLLHSNTTHTKSGKNDFPNQEMGSRDEHVNAA